MHRFLFLKVRAAKLKAQEAEINGKGDIKPLGGWCWSEPTDSDQTLFNLLKTNEKKCALAISLETLGSRRRGAEAIQPTSKDQAGILVNPSHVNRLKHSRSSALPQKPCESRASTMSAASPETFLAAKSTSKEPG
eukprot:Skav236621  [mRNA]  locus=scaffold4458:36625:39759:+ [translate_table: standard]